MYGWNAKELLRRLRKRRVKLWHLFAAVFVLVLASLYLLRQNNLRMVELRNLVIQADEQQTDVAGALERLNEHVFHHMNTEIVRPIELVTSYNVQAQAILEKASKGSGRDIYAEATAACERQGIPPTTIAQCAANYAIENNQGIDPAEIQLPDKDQFVYSFATPLWTPDLAGFSVLLTVVAAAWLLLRLIEYSAVRMVLKKRAKKSFF